MTRRVLGITTPQGLDTARDIARTRREIPDFPPRFPSYPVAALPSAAKYLQGMIYVPDETGGAVMAFSDGTDWRRLTDRAVVS